MSTPGASLSGGVGGLRVGFGEDPPHLRGQGMGFAESSVEEFGGAHGGDR